MLCCACPSQFPAGLHTDPGHFLRPSCSEQGSSQCAELTAYGSYSGAEVSSPGFIQLERGCLFRTVPTSKDQACTSSPGTRSVVHFWSLFSQWWDWVLPAPLLSVYFERSSHQVAQAALKTLTPPPLSPSWWDFGSNATVVSRHERELSGASLGTYLVHVFGQGDDVLELWFNR